MGQIHNDGWSGYRFDPTITSYVWQMQESTKSMSKQSHTLPVGFFIALLTIYGVVILIAVLHICRQPTAAVLDRPSVAQTYYGECAV